MSGFNAWLIQRLSAFLLLFGVIAVMILLLFFGLDYASWQALISNTGIKLFSTLFALLLLVHAWIGIRNIILDYVHPFGLRLVKLFLAIIYLLLNGMWLVAVIWEVH